MPLRFTFNIDLTSSVNARIEYHLTSPTGNRTTCGAFGLLDLRCTRVRPKPEDFFITHLKRQWANAFGTELGFGVLFGYSLGFFPYVE